MALNGIFLSNYIQYTQKEKAVQVLIDTTIGKSIEIPDWLREAIVSYEPALK